MKKLFLIFILFTSLSFSSAKWTIMVYLDGDNDLESWAIKDFLEMSKIGSDENINIVVQFDRISGDNSSFGNWSICHRFYITQEMTPEESNAIPDWGDGKGGREVNMGDPQTLTDFIYWAKTNYPAEKYALILWNHGNGWRNLYQPLGKEKPPVKEVCWDDTDGDYLSVKEVRQAIENAGGVDLIGFDACLMGMIEVAYEMKGLADVFVASEETEPATGWDYETILSNLRKNPLSTAYQLGEIIVNSYSDDTLSAVDLRKIENLKNSLDSAVNLIMSNNLYLDVYLARSETKTFDEPFYADLYDFFEKLSENTDNETLITEIQQFKDVFNQTVFADNDLSDNAYGLSIYFPDYGGTVSSDYNGSTISFPGESHWDEFLNAFVNAELFSDFTLLFSQDFSSGLPENWTVIDGYSDGKTWTDTNPGNRSLDLTSPFMIVDSDWAGNTDMDEQLITPLLDFSGYPTVYLEFSTVFWYWENEIADVDVKVGDEPWQNVKRFQREDKDGKVVLNLSSIAGGKNNVQIRWHYYDANWDWLWAVDDVKIWGKEAEKGDINADGEIDITDVILCMRMAVGLPVTISGQTYNSPYPEWLIELADMNSDGEVDITDVILILRKAVGLD